jgi:peptidoglycan/LPS O-acetylase OafA/YrhL
VVQLVADRNSAKQRLIGLDLLRFLAIVLVLGRHMLLPPESWPEVVRGAFATWNRGGWIGVDLFFVLSGFLVSGLLFSEYQNRGSISFRRFFVRRGWKIYPPFFFMIAVSVLVFTAFPGLKKEIQDGSLLAELLFIQSYSKGLWNHTWSLAVEEQFYLSLPFILFLLLRRNRTENAPLRPILWVSLVAIVGCLLMRILNWYVRAEYSHQTHSFATHLRLDSLFFGVALSYGYTFHNRKFTRLLAPRRKGLLILGMLLLLPAFCWTVDTTPLLYTVGYSVISLGSSMILVAVLLSKPPQNRLLTTCSYLGVYSYSIYLWHMPVSFWGPPIMESLANRSLSFTSLTAIYLVGSIVVGVILAKAVELPTLRIRDHWFPCQTQRGWESSADDKPQTECPQAAESEQQTPVPNCRS